VHRGHGQPDPLGQIRVGQPAVRGQRGYDRAIDLLHGENVHPGVDPVWILFVIL